MSAELHVERTPRTQVLTLASVFASSVSPCRYYGNTKEEPLKAQNNVFHCSCFAMNGWTQLLLIILINAIEQSLRQYH